MSRADGNALRPGRPGTWRPGAGAWLAGAVGALCFLNSVANDFVYDDKPIIRDNPRIRSLTRPAEIWLSDWWLPRDREDEVMHRYRDRLYRPLTMYTFALNYAFGGDAPAGYHGVNVALHAAVCVLVWRLAQRLFGDAAISTGTALLFAVHPIHCEAVANVVGRAEVLATFFLLAGLLSLLPADRPAGVGRAAGAALLFLAALFSKETAVCYVPVALLALHAGGHAPPRRVRRWWLMHTLILLAPLLVYLPLRYIALEQRLLRDLPPQPPLNPLVWADLPHRWLHALTILGHYTRLLIVPARLSANYGLRVLDPDRGVEALTLVGEMTAVLALLALNGYGRKSVLWRGLALLSAWSIASYALISNTVLLIGVSLAERLFYWPSVPALLALAVVGVHGWRRAVAGGRFSAGSQRLLRVCGVLLLVALGLRSVVRNRDWSSNQSLFDQDVQTYPESVELREAAASERLWEIQRIYRSGESRDLRPLLEEADRHLQAALGIYPRSQSGLQLRGRVLGMLGRREEARAHFEAASRLGSLDRISRQFLAQLRDGAAEGAARAVALADAIATRPADAALRSAYGELLLQLGRDREALVEMEEAVRLAPNDANALRLLGDAYAARNEGARAIDTYRRAIAIDPGDWRVHFNLAGLLALRDPAAALQHAQEAYRLQPTGVETNQALAELLAVNGRLSEALTLYRALAQGLPAENPLRPAIVARIRDLEQGRR